MDDDYSNECTRNNNDKRCCKCIHCCSPIGCLLNKKERSNIMEKEPITLDELIIQLVELSRKGYGDRPVTANMEYTVWGASIDTRFDFVDFDCYL